MKLQLVIQGEVMPAKRRRKPCRGQVEDDLLANARWSGLQEQTELQAGHSERENCGPAAQQELLEQGWGAGVGLSLRGEVIAHWSVGAPSQ